VVTNLRTTSSRFTLVSACVRKSLIATAACTYERLRSHGGVLHSQFLTDLGICRCKLPTVHLPAACLPERRMLPLVNLKSRLFCAGKNLMALLHKSSSISRPGSSICSRASLLAAAAHTAPIPALARARSSSTADRRLYSGSAAAAAAAAAAAGKGDNNPHTFLFTSESVTEVRTFESVCIYTTLPMRARRRCHSASQRLLAVWLALPVPYLLCCTPRHNPQCQQYACSSSILLAATFTQPYPLNACL
jgi:hypothetical protein